jgi:hypothetical protein
MFRRFAMALVWACGLHAVGHAAPTRLDLVRGPIISTSRITGLAGAFTGIALGIDGTPYNPAAFAHRPESSDSWFDWDLGFGLLVVPGKDVDWNGDGLAPGQLAADRGDGLEFQAVNLGLLLQPGPVGLGAYADIYGWQAGDISVSHFDAHVGGGLALLDGHLVLGLAAHLATLSITEGEAATELEGVAPSIGVLFRPEALSFAFGARFRPTIRLEALAGADTPYLGIIPWQVSVGASFRMTADGRPYNRPHRAPTGPIGDRRYLLVSMDLVATGASDGITLEGLVGRAATTALSPRLESGLGPSLGLRLGGEGEVVDNRLRARFGTYLEPLRVVDEPAFRIHLTGGAELRLFELLFDWKLNVSFDFSPGWRNFSFGIGIW